MIIKMMLQMVYIFKTYLLLFTAWLVYRNNVVLKYDVFTRVHCVIDIGVARICDWGSFLVSRLPMLIDI